MCRNISSFYVISQFFAAFDALVFLLGWSKHAFMFKRCYFRQRFVFMVDVQNVISCKILRIYNFILVHLCTCPNPFNLLNPVETSHVCGTFTNVVDRIKVGGLIMNEK